MTEFIVRQGDVVEEPSDLLLLKYARRFYGADHAVAKRLISGGRFKFEDLQPAAGDCVIVQPEGIISPKCVLFMGTPPLGQFLYDEMEEFAQAAIKSIADSGLQVGTLTTTVHGTGYGLDGGESLQRLVIGFAAGMAKYDVSIEQIVFLAREARECRMLTSVLDKIDRVSVGRPGNVDTIIPKLSDPRAEQPPEEPPQTRIPPLEPGDAVSVAQAHKTRVFVAMPYSDEFENVYEFGIYPAIRNCGFICEKVNETHFTGDVLARIREGIESATLVVADVTEGRPNVYLEVGYAWGKGVPVIFVARKGEKLPFDVSTHRCIFYGKFSVFADELEKLIKGIQPSS